MRFLAVALALPAARAFTAFSGDFCNGAQGANVPCDGTCHSFAGRHSFDTALDGACVSVWTASGCVGKRFNLPDQRSGQCTNVNTGTNIQSFRCYKGAGVGCG
ncbi:hypothetical protein AURDEDRAFT_164924 [Auricularia subglabra TFB-10046 SS5]|nr:hypothetical protein AURDEDRAFT_164924 [Auricularia subglabra TFB-10046 SS5]